MSIRKIYIYIQTGNHTVGRTICPVYRTSEVRTIRSLADPLLYIACQTFITKGLLDVCVIITSEICLGICQVNKLKCFFFFG